MTILSSKRWFPSSLATAWLLASGVASAQTPPPDQTPPPPPPAEVTPPPPPPAEAPPPVKVELETYPKVGKSNEIFVTKDLWVRVGGQVQVWFDYLQAGSGAAMAPTDGSYAVNFLVRRGRAIISAGYKEANVFFQLDAPRLGLGTLATTLPVVNCTTTQNAMTMALTTTCASAVGKRFNAQDGGGAIVQDAWGEIKLAGDAFMIEGGLMVIPFAHNELQSTTTFLTLDVSTVATQVPFTSGTRDVGLQLKGYVADDKLEYRLGVFSGNRQATNGTNVLGHNMPRIAGKLQYQFFDVDKGYVYVGHTYGKRKILGLSAGFDVQKNDDVQAADGSTTPSGTYYAASAGVFGAIPLSGDANKAGGDEIAFIAEYYRYSNGVVQDTSTPPKTTTIPTGAVLPQNDFLVEAAYYNNDAKVSVFGKFEMRALSFDNITDGQKAANNQQWVGGGLKWYAVPGNNMNFTAFFQRILFPDSVTGAPSGANEFVLQAQYFVY
jgi:hypothetical protein